MEFVVIVFGSMIVLLTGLFLLYYTIGRHWLVPVFYTWLGSQDTSWSWKRVRPPEGEFYIMAEGKSNGPFAMIIESVKEADYDEERDLFVPIDEAGREAQRRQRNDPIERTVAQVGFNRKFFEREIKHFKLKQVPSLEPGKPPEWRLEERIRGVWRGGKPPSYFRNHQLAIWIQQLEIAGNIQIDAVIDLTVQIESPQRAFFFEGGWWDKLPNVILATFKAYAGNKELEHLREEQAQGAGTLVEAIYARNGANREEKGSLRENSGVLITNANFAMLEVSGSPEMKRATEALKIADLEAQAEKRRGEGKRDRDLAEAEGRKALVEALGSQGAAIAQSQAIAEAKPGVVVFGNSGATPAINVADVTKKEGDGKGEPKKKEEK